MLIRFKHWEIGGVPAHKALDGPREYVFLDAELGLCDVRHRKGIEFLLARPTNYELVYEHYGVHFDAQGNEQHAPTPGEGSPSESKPAVDDWDSTVRLARLADGRRKPGRPRKVRV